MTQDPNSAQHGQRLGAAIVAGRAARKWTQTDLAKAVGVHRQAVALWEAGRGMTDANLAAVRQALGADFREPTPPLSASEMAYWRGRTEQIANHMAAVLEEQRQMVRDMAGIATLPEVAAVEAYEARQSAADDVPPRLVPRSRRRSAG